MTRRGGGQGAVLKKSYPLDHCPKVEKKGEKANSDIALVRDWHGRRDLHCAKSQEQISLTMKRAGKTTRGKMRRIKMRGYNNGAWIVMDHHRILLCFQKLFG